MSSNLSRYDIYRALGYFGAILQIFFVWPLCAQCQAEVLQENFSENSPALAAIVKAAEAGDPSAQNKLAGIYYKRSELVENESKAIGLLKKAVEKGFVPAQINLARIYSNGKGAHDYAESAALFEKAVAAGDARAMGNLGAMYMRGLGVPKNEKKAVELYREGSKKGDAIAQINLGTCYMDGHCSELQKDGKLAFEMYSKVAAQKLSIGYLQLGLLYDEGNGVQQNDAKAFENYKIAAEMGNIIAQCNLGVMFRDGRGVEKADKTAEEWFRKASVGGYASAKTAIAQMLQEKSRNLNIPLSIEVPTLLKDAAMQGDPTAQGMLGLLYARGQGLPLDEVQAFIWMNLSAQTLEKARDNLQILISGMTQNQVEEAQKKSLDLGSKISKNINPLPVIDMEWVQ